MTALGAVSGPNGGGCGGGGGAPAPAPAPAVAPAAALPAPAPPPPNPAVVARQALGGLALVMPAPQFSPSPGRELVHFPIWLWVHRSAWVAQTASVTAGPVSVTVTAVPQATTWDMGDERANRVHALAIGPVAPSSRVRCVGPGTPWDPSAGLDTAMPSPDCGYSYAWWSGEEPAGRFAVTTTMSWHVSWIANTGAAGDFGQVTRSARTALEVDEAQALNTTPGSGGQ